MKHMKPSTESFLALFLACVGVLPTLAWRSVDLFSLAMYLSPPWVLAWLFAISGIRRANGAARLAAIASLTVLIFQAILLGVVAFAARRPA
jgi:hypothetical protein